MRRWFEAEGVELKTEADGRVFPVTDDSRRWPTRCNRCSQSRCTIQRRGAAATTTIDVADGGFAVTTGDDAYEAAAVVLATGSAPGYALAKALGHEPVKPCRRCSPSGSSRRCSRASPACPCRDARVELKGAKKKPPPPTRGPLLVTHRGLSGPAALDCRRSRRGSCRTAGMGYARGRFTTGRVAGRRALDARRAQEEACGATVAGTTRPFSQLPKRLWARLVAHANVREVTTRPHLCGN